jgi:hypothetical protein
MEEANTQAYYDTSTITSVKSFITQAPGPPISRQGTLTEWEDSVRLTSLYLLVCIISFFIENIIYLFTKLATLMRRSIVLNLSLQLVFAA